MYVDRSYLPFPCARKYEDRKMKKWMGFFLSEHTAAMKVKPAETLSDERMEISEVLMLISQSYTNKIELAIDCHNEIITGVVDVINGNQIGIKTHNKYWLKGIDEIKFIEVIG